MSTALSAPPDVPRSSVGRPGRGARVRWVVVALTSLAIVGYVLAVYAKGSLGTLSKSGAGLSTTYAGRALPIQVAFYCHITFAALALLVGPLQFVVAVRRRRPLLHRWIGRMFLVSVGVGSLAAGVMSLFNSAGIDGFFGFGTLAVLWAWTAWRGYTSVRAHDYASHQAWMIRCFALTYAGVTLRAWFGVLIGVQLLFAAGPIDADHVMSTAYAVLPFLSWLPNLVVAELLIRRRGLPALALTPPPPHPSTSTLRLTRPALHAPQRVGQPGPARRSPSAPKIGAVGADCVTKHPVADAESRDLQERELIKTAALTRGVTEALCHRRVNALQASLTAYAGVGVFITAYDRWIDQDGARTWAGWSTSPCTSFDAQSALRTG